MFSCLTKRPPPLFDFDGKSTGYAVKPVFRVLSVQVGLPPQPIRDRVLYHVRHVLCGGPVGHQWPASGCQSGSSGRKPHSQFISICYLCVCVLVYTVCKWMCYRIHIPFDFIYLY